MVIACCVIRDVTSCSMNRYGHDEGKFHRVPAIFMCRGKEMLEELTKRRRNEYMVRVNRKV